MRGALLVFFMVILNVSGAAGLSKLVTGRNYFFQYCAACHSLKYTSVALLTQELPLAYPWRERLYHGKWLSPLDTEDALHWFGRVPPDLSLIGIQHSKIWLQHYLMGFYSDSQHPWGRNNRVVLNVAMPDVLYTVSNRREVVDDITDFLMYAARPETQVRHKIGSWVLLLAGIAILLAGFSRKAYKF